jgi:hypothetical protein
MDTLSVHIGFCLQIIVFYSHSDDIDIDNILLVASPHVKLHLSLNKLKMLMNHRNIISLIQMVDLILC